MGVLFIRSAPSTYKTGPSWLSRSTFSSFTEDSPTGFGRKGERVANTPIRVFPPSLGGLTVGDQSVRSALENFQISHRCEYPESPLNASLTRYSFLKTIRDTIGESPLCLGMPNFSVKSFSMYAIIFIILPFFRRNHENHIFFGYIHFANFDVISIMTIILAGFST